MFIPYQIIIIGCLPYNNNNEKNVLRHKMLMQTQQRTPLSSRWTRSETNVSSAIIMLLKLNKEIKLPYNSLGREFHILYSNSLRGSKADFYNLNIFNVETNHITQYCLKATG